MTEPRSDPASPAQVVEGNPAEPVFAGTVADLLQRGVRVRFRASGSSMAPAILDGDAITVEPAPGARLRRGDVLLVRRGEGVVAHRLVGRRRRPAAGLEYLLRGDAADGNDSPVPAADVLGRVAEVERAGVRTRPSGWSARLAALLRFGLRQLRC
jgi:hypothetical protein